MRAPPPTEKPGAARKEPTFEALLGALVRNKQLAEEPARRLFEGKDAQLSALVRQRAKAASGGPPSGRATAASATALELFLSFPPTVHDVREDAATEVYAGLAGMPFVTLDPLKLDAALPVRTLSKPFARRHAMLVIAERETSITVATPNPFDAGAVESVERVTGKRVEIVMAAASDVDRIIMEFYGFRQSVQRAEEHLSVGIDLGNLEQLVRMKSDREIEASDEHVVHAVDYMLRYAFGQRASDIHIEPKREESDVRYRIDGALHKVSKLPRLVHAAVVNRIKMLARLDIAERRRPQDGRIKTEFLGKAVDIRVSTLPVAFGEKIVMRIFDPGLIHDDVSELGFFERDQRVLEEILAMPHGIFLVTGPTGSGKTTTLYTALRKLAKDAVNVTTIEDPIENVLESINQTAINPAIGLGFAECLRTILRQDPDVIMVGEIRDLDTARYAIQAALTGHLVLSTLHTNDAAGAITRLLDLGVQDFLLASTLVGVMAQRLIKKVCPTCARDRVLARDEAANLALDASSGEMLIRQGAGCADCRRTGYKGRTALTELFRVDATIRDLIHQRAPDARITDQAVRDGMTTLRECAVRRMLLGETTYEQVLDVTSGR
jgi:general secretion pathway protein E